MFSSRSTGRIRGVEEDVMVEPAVPLGQEGLEEPRKRHGLKKLEMEEKRHRKAARKAALAGDTAGFAAAAVRWTMCQLAASPVVDERLLREWMKCYLKLGKGTTREEKKSTLHALRDRKPAELVV